MDKNNRRIERGALGECRESDDGINTQQGDETFGSRENINESSHVELEKNLTICEETTIGDGPDKSSNGMLNKLAKSGCFGPFINNMHGNEVPLNESEINFNSAQDKRRRLMRNGMAIESSNSNMPHPSLDLNRTPILSQIPLPDTNVESSSSPSEIRNTVEVGNILGFEIDSENPILKEILGDNGENQIIQ